MELVLNTLEDLVGFDTVSRKPNDPIIDYIESFCRDRGAKMHRIPGSTEGKSGILARFGPDEVGGITLSGHTDVVPTDGQDWTRPAFGLTCEGKRLFGRGTTDMKGFLACMLDAGDSAYRAGLEKPLTLVFSFDEEVGCVGIQEMKRTLPGLLGKPRLCIVGEPTEMQVAVGHKGKVALRAHCFGKGGHSALAPHFVNALHLSADLISGLRELQGWFREHGARDPSYEVPYTTLHVGKLVGGTALNIVPDFAEVLCEYRYLPADGDANVFARIRDTADRIAADYKGLWSGAAIKMERYFAYPGLDIEHSSDAAQLALDLTTEKVVTKVDFGTEAGVFTELGIPAVVCGPGSMAGQGHKPDEYIELDQLVACKSMLDKVVEQLS